MLALLLAGSVRFVGGETVFPGADWERATNGLRSETVAGVDAYVRTLDTTALMIVRHGRLVYEYGDIKRLSYLASARKSVLSMLYGPYVASGKIQLETTVKELGMSDVGGLLPSEERARVVDLITARSGVYHPAANSGDLLAFAPKRGAKAPGTWWLYSNWDFNAAGAAFERMTGLNIYDALRDDLAIPLGFQDFDRRRQQKSGDLTRSQYPAYHLMLSTRDMARLGLLMLNEGKWSERQLIPVDWVRRTTAVQTPLAEMQPPFGAVFSPMAYGFMWWVWDTPFATGPYQGAYTAAGAFGQYITVLPALDMVVAHKTWPAGNVGPNDYLYLLDLITGKRCASKADLLAWHHPRLCRRWRRIGFGLALLLRLAGRYRWTTAVVSGSAGLMLYVVAKKLGFRRFLKIAALAAGAIGGIGGLAVWVLTPATAPVPPPARVAIKVDPGLYDAYAGQYLITAGARAPRNLTLKRDGDGLFCQFAGYFAEEIFPQSETVFFNTRETALVAFVRNDKNTVIGLNLSLDGKSYWAKKVGSGGEIQAGPAIH